MIGLDFVQGINGPVPVRKIRHGDIITEAGVYDMPASWYHDACTDGPGMSSSGLRRLWTKTPAHYWDVSPYNPNRAPDPEVQSAPLRIGRAAHTLLLEPDLFRGQFKTRPAHWDTWATKASKEWRAEQQLAGITILDPAEMQRVVGIAQSLRKHPLYGEGILDGDLERSLIWRDEKTGLWLKARPDAIPRGSDILADLKCLHAADTESLARDIYASGYDMQLALCGVGMHELLGRNVTDNVLVVVENDRPHAARVVAIPPEEIDRGRLLLRTAVNHAAECFERGEWPSYEAEDSGFIYRRKSATERIESLINLGVIQREW